VAWDFWTGQPNLIASIARCAVDLVSSESSTESSLRIKLEAPTVEGEYATVGDFLTEIPALDLTEIQSIGIEARASERRIAVSMAQSPFRSESRAAWLSVSGPERDWVQRASQMAAVIDGGWRLPFRYLKKTLLVGALMFVGGWAAIELAHDDQSGSSGFELAAKGTLFAGLALASLSGVGMLMAPRLRLLPEGEATWGEQFGGFVRRERDWTIRSLILLVLGAIFGWLIQYVT